MSSEPTIKAIPTKFRGHTFRSRLEARWAVWLHTYGVDYRYEDEGFKLLAPDFKSDGTVGDRELWYLPDFYVPSWDAFVEIKPTADLSADEGFKAMFLSQEAQKPVIVICGQPWPGEYTILLYDDDGLPSEEPSEFWFCLYSHSLWIRSKNRDDEWGLRLEPDKMSTDGRARYAFWPKGGDRLHDAFRAARSARFEHHKQA